MCLQLAQLPSTRCLTVEEFEAAQQKQSEGADPEELTADAVEAEEAEEQQGANRESPLHKVLKSQPCCQRHAAQPLRLSLTSAYTKL